MCNFVLVDFVCLSKIEDMLRKGLFYNSNFDTKIKIEPYNKEIANHCTAYLRDWFGNKYTYSPCKSVDWSGNRLSFPPNV